MFGMTRYSNPMGSGAYGAVIEEAKGGLLDASAEAKKAMAGADPASQAAAVRKLVQTRAVVMDRAATLANLASQAPASERPAIVDAHQRLKALYDGEIAPLYAMISKNVLGAAGYYPLGGKVVAPPGAGKYLLVPFETTTAAPAIGARYVTTTAGSNNAITLTTPQLTWLNKYRFRGIIARAYRTAGAVNDFIALRQFRIQGAPDAFSADNTAYEISQFNPSEIERSGLRYNGELGNTTRAQVIVDHNAGPAGSVAGGSATILVWMVIEVLEDQIYGALNNPAQRRAYQNSLQAVAQIGGYEFDAGTPVASTQERLPMLVETAAGTNTAGQAGSFVLTPGAAVLNLISPEISYAANEIVGFQFHGLTKDNVQDILMTTGPTVAGGTQLNAAEGLYEASAFLGDVDPAFGGNASPVVGLRFYPAIGKNNRVRLAIQGVDSTGALNAAPLGNLRVRGIDLIVNRISDDTLGMGVGTPYSNPANFIQQLASFPQRLVVLE
jgi:hypothetical protein